MIRRNQVLFCSWCDTVMWRRVVFVSGGFRIMRGSSRYSLKMLYFLNKCMVFLVGLFAIVYLAAEWWDTTVVQQESAFVMCCFCSWILCLCYVSVKCVLSCFAYVCLLCLFIVESGRMIVICWVSKSNNICEHSFKSAKQILWSGDSGESVFCCKHACTCWLCEQHFIRRSSRCTCCVMNRVGQCKYTKPVCSLVRVLKCGYVFVIHVSWSTVWIRASME